ncbi:MAG: hypothetical protein RSB86_10145 [Comamonas sp.]|jgi:hypothetical protein|uniref:hypothetical protein n=1 Tax=Comamonas sp. TaxID=34028 RepID=UPI002FCB61CC
MPSISLRSKALCACLFAVLCLNTAHARNTPCSGKKGGVSHCQGEKVVCKDGTISGSKKICS